MNPTSWRIAQSVREVVRTIQEYARRGECWIDVQGGLRIPVHAEMTYKETYDHRIAVLFLFLASTAGGTKRLLPSRLTSWRRLERQRLRSLFQQQTNNGFATGYAEAFSAFAMRSDVYSLNSPQVPSPRRSGIRFSLEHLLKSIQYYAAERPSRVRPLRT